MASHLEGTVAEGGTSTMEGVTEATRQDTVVLAEVASPVVAGKHMYLSSLFFYKKCYVCSIYSSVFKCLIFIP